MLVRIQTNSTEVIEATMMLGIVVQPGLSDVLLKIRRVSDDYLYDFDDDTFKASGWTSETVAMTEIDATNQAGQYKYTFDTSAITNATADDSYIPTVNCASANNVPQSGEIKVGDFVDDIDAPVSAVAAGVWSETLEGSYTAADLQRLQVAMLAANTGGVGTPTETFLDLAGGKIRITINFDADLNRIVTINDAT